MFAGTSPMRPQVAYISRSQGWKRQGFCSTKAFDTPLNRDRRQPGLAFPSNDTELVVVA